MVTRQKLKRDTGIQKVLRIRRMTPDTEHAVSNSFPFGVSLYRHTVPRIYWREAGLVLRDIAAAVAGRAMLNARVCVCVHAEMCVRIHPEMFTFLDSVPPLSRWKFWISLRSGVRLREHTRPVTRPRTRFPIPFYSRRQELFKQSYLRRITGKTRHVRRVCRDRCHLSRWNDAHFRTKSVRCARAKKCRAIFPLPHSVKMVEINQERS